MGKHKKKKKDRRTVKEVLGDMAEHVGNAVHNVMGNVSQSIGNVLNDTANAAQWLALIPFKSGMVRVLKARGIPVPKKLDDIAKAFFTNVIHKQRFEEYFSVHQAAVKLGKHSAKVRNNFIGDHFTASGDHLIDEAVDATVAIVKNIVQWFKDRKARKAAGGTLPADEEAAVNAYDMEMEKAGGDERAVTDDTDDDDKSSTTLWVIIVSALLLVVIMAFALT